MKPLNRNQMAWRAAQDIQDGTVVNLGLGIPVLVADYLPAGRDVFFQSENGIVGVGPVAAPDKEDTDLVDAGSRRITLRRGAAIVESAWSFAMIRGGHIDVTILGAFEVAANGDLANWDMRVPNKGPLVGGAMDLAVGAKATWVIMEHNTRAGGAAPAARLRPAAHRGPLRQARLHRHRRRRRDARGLRRPRDPGGHDPRRAACAHRRAADRGAGLPAACGAADRGGGLRSLFRPQAPQAPAPRRGAKSP